MREIINSYTESFQASHFQGIFSGKTAPFLTIAYIYFYRSEIRRMGVKMNKVTKIGAVITAAIALSLTGTAGSFAADAAAPVVKKVALTPEQKAAFEAAKAQFQAARDARQAAVATAKASIATAKSNFDAAKATATSKEAREAARAALKAAVDSAKAAIPAKPAKPVRP